MWALFKRAIRGPIPASSCSQWLTSPVPAARNFRIGERIFTPAGSFAFRERKSNGLAD
jgi:hypothetical protein